MLAQSSDIGASTAVFNQILIRDSHHDINNNGLQMMTTPSHGNELNLYHKGQMVSPNSGLNEDVIPS